MSIEDDLITDLGRYSKDPLKFVLWAFEWGVGPLKNRSLEQWQIKCLIDIRDGLSVDKAIRKATASGNGVGKSALVSWIILWAMTTLPDTRGVVTANTETQLKTKTWAELSKWYQLFIAKSLFQLDATALFSRDPDHKLSWRVDMIPWSEQNYVAFQGLHNEGKRLFILFDEASGIADIIWESAEGCMTDANTERLFLAFGNPNMASGRFFECFNKYAHRWRPARVDSRTVSFSDKSEIQGWIDDYGEDSDFVRVRVLGEFPRAGSFQFISTFAVQEAQKRESTASIYDALVMGVDVARFGDDKSVIRFRRGQDAKTLPSVKLRGANTMEVAARVIQLYEQHKPDAVFIDGGGPGAGVIDRCRMLKIPVIEVQFGSKADRSMIGQDDSFIYANKRAEMYGALREWLKHGCLDSDRELEVDLISVQYGYVIKEGKDAIILEKKEGMKRRGLASPDDGDALALTFAYPVQPSDHTRMLQKKPVHQIEYNPFAGAFNVTRGAQL